MYGYRKNNTIRNFVLTFLAGWVFGQVFTIQPKSFDTKVIQKSVESVR